jgi:hypothetical protein
MLPPPPVLAPPGGAEVLVGLTVMLGTGAGGAVVAVVDGAGVGGVVGGLAGGVDGFGVGVWQVHVGEGDGVGVWQVQVGVGVGLEAVGAGVGLWQLVHLGVGVGLFPPPPWLLTAATTPVRAADRVDACAAVLVIMNAATPKAKQPDSTRMRIAISRSFR